MTPGRCRICGEEPGPDELVWHQPGCRFESREVATARLTGRTVLQVLGIPDRPGRWTSTSPRRQARIDEAVRLRGLGLTYRQIGRQLGVTGNQARVDVVTRLQGPSTLAT